MRKRHRRLYPFTSYHTSFFAYICHKGIANGLDIILPRLYPLQQKYIIKRKIWTAPILKVKKKCGIYLLYYLWIKKSMQNASSPKSCSYGKQKNKEIALTNNLFLAFPAGIEPTVYRLGGDCVIRLRYGKILTFWKLLNGTKIIKFIPILIPICFFMLTKHNIWCIFALLCAIFSDM